MSAFAAVTAVVLLILIAIFVALTLWVRRHPLEAFVKMTRRGLLRAGMTRREVDVDGHQTVYFTGGGGKRTIVLVHGVNDQAGTWATVAPRLLRQFRVIAIDLPGHGESGPAIGPLPMRMLVSALRTVIDREQPEGSVILLGNSMGGWVSMLYAAAEPSRVDHLILEDASGMTWDISHVPAFPKNREEALRLLRMVQGPDTPIAEYLIEAMLKTARVLPQARVLEAGIVEWLVDARLPRLTMPTTLIWGANDGLLTVQYAETLKRRLPDATLHVIDKAAHIPHRQAPAAFLEIVADEVNRAADGALVHA